MKHLLAKRLRPTGLLFLAALWAGAGAGSYCYADTMSSSAAVRPNNSLLVDVQVTTGTSVAQVRVTYRTMGVEPLVSQLTQVSATGSTTITIGRLRANRTYTYDVEGFDREGAPAGNASASFTTGPLPAGLLTNTYTLTGRTTAPLVIVQDNQPGFRGWVGLDLHSPDAPQIVWYDANTPSNASGALQIDTVGSIVRERNGNLLFGDAGTGGPTSLDTFYREIKPDGTLLAQSPPACVLAPAQGLAAPKGWVWGQGNDWHEQLLPGADGVRGTVLHLGRIFRDPFFDAGQAAQGKRLQAGSTIRRWNPAAGTDEIVWDPFNFLDPLTERTNASNSDPGNSSDLSSGFPCAGASLQSEEWMHVNSLQVAPSGAILLSVRYLDTIVAISPQFDRIAWRIGRFKSDFGFPSVSDKFYHEHYVRMLENGNLLLFDNGNGRPAAEGGQYSRALELALDWRTMTAAKVWEYRHQVGTNGAAPIYKYSDRVGSAQRLENGNTIVWFGADVDPTTLNPKSPQTYTLVEADSSPEAAAVAVLNVQIPPGTGFPYRALPVETLFGEIPGPSGPPLPPTITPGGIVPGTIQPGEWASIYGTNLAIGTTVWKGDSPTSLGGAGVTINGKAAYLSFVSPGQINFQAPDDTATGTVPVTVTTIAGSASSSVTLAPLSPSLFLLDAKHVAGIILRSDKSGAYGGGTYDIIGPTGKSLGYATVAARAGDTIELFGTGFGPTTPTVQAGQAFSGSAPTTNAAIIGVNNMSVTPTFVGLSGQGLYQLNMTVPTGLGTGDVPLRVTIGGVQTQTGVVISLQ